MGLDKFRKSGHRPDYVFIGLILILLCIGLLMIMSSSILVASEKFGNNYYYVMKQLYSIIIGAVIFIITASIDFRFYKKIAVLFFIVALILTIMVLIPGIGSTANGAQRWLDFGFVRFQASEVLKLATVIYLAQWMVTKKKDLNNIAGFVPFLCILGLVAGVVVAQRDLGTTLVISGIMVAMYFLAGGGIQFIGLVLGLGLLIIMLLIKFEPYRMTRFLVFLDPSQQQLGAAYHINQALLAIGSGGLWGLGFGESRQKYFYLPEAHTDSIFAIMCEELGFIRIMLFLILLVIFVLKGFVIAKKVPDEFGKLLCSGIMCWVAIQSILNIAAMLGLLPLTGVPLPLISYGGTSVSILLAALGIVVNISKYSTREEKSKYVRA